MELELKFALAGQDPQTLPALLARVPLIGRRHPQRLALHNTYYDTPTHALHARQVALRVRHMGEGQRPQWLQTLKMGGGADSALSRRGEWEAALDSKHLSPALLADTPWHDIDPDGSLLQALAPVFTTTFERLLWTVHLDGTVVEVALDRGSVHMDGHSTPLCELEIELQSGAPEALFAVARQISQRLCLLPLHLSKAERAFRLAQGTLQAPWRARPPLLSPAMDLDTLAHSVLRECFSQFTANLLTLQGSAAPEVLHQARVGWRRFKSALKLFRQPVGSPDLPALATLSALKPLLTQMAALRDLEVVASEVLPTYAAAFQAGNAQGPQQAKRQWQQLQHALAAQMDQQRQAMLQALTEPAVGASLLAITRWLELGRIQPVPKPRKRDRKAPAQWLGLRLHKLADDIRATQEQPQDDAARHHLRIRCKRLRYGVESLQPLLPPKTAKRWLRLARDLQTRLGLERDFGQATQVARQLQAPDSVVAFLRGAAFCAGML